jgi:hypothetical protein
VTVSRVRDDRLCGTKIELGDFLLGDVVVFDDCSGDKERVLFQTRRYSLFTHLCFSSDDFQLIQLRGLILFTRDLSSTLLLDL